MEKKIDTVGMMPLTPFPGTPQFEELKDRIFSKNWELYDVQHVVYYPEQMTPYDLYMNVLEGYPRFYNPKGREFFRIKKDSKPKFFKLDSLFEILVQNWSYRSFLLYQLELIANSRYSAWLKTLPNKDQIDEIDDFTLENEHLRMHKILKNRLDQRMSRLM